MKRSTVTPRSLHDRKGLRALMGAGALLALAVLAAICIIYSANPEKVISGAERAADSAAPLCYSFSYNAGTTERPDQRSVIVRSNHFIRRGDAVQSIEGLYYDIDWSDKISAFTLERLPDEQQEPSALRRWRTVRLTLLILPWVLASLLLLAVFCAIGIIVARDLKTLEEVARALESDRAGRTAPPRINR